MNKLLSKTALLLVDLQNDFLPGGSLAVKEGNTILPVIDQLIQLPFALVVASKDWHPADHGSFASTHEKNVGEIVNLKGLSQVLWPVHCVQKTQGAEFSDQWNHQEIDKVFYKGTDRDIDSYSAFFDNGHQKATGLHAYLQENGIKELFIAGLTTDYCVKFSVLDALKLGYNVSVVVDACRPVNLHPDDELESLEEMSKNGATLLLSKEIRQ